MRDWSAPEDAGSRRTWLQRLSDTESDAVRWAVALGIVAVVFAVVGGSCYGLVRLSSGQQSGEQQDSFDEPELLQPKPAGLPPDATCQEYLDADARDREIATRAALITARRGAGVTPEEPDREMRASFEILVGLVCDESRSARMLDVMAAVILRDHSFTSPG